MCWNKLSKYADSGRILGRAVSKLYAKNPEMTNVKRRRKIGRRPGQSRDQKMPRWTNSYSQKRPKGTTGVPNGDQTGAKMPPKRNQNRVWTYGAVLENPIRRPPCGVRRVDAGSFNFVSRNLVLFLSNFNFVSRNLVLF